ncbi:MAG: GAF domain-containing protein [Bdellovibrionota bacterium]
MLQKDTQQALEKQIERLFVLSELGKTFTSTVNLDQLQQSILKTTSDILLPESWHLLIKNRETGDLDYKILINDPALNRNQPVKIGEGLSGWVAQTQQAILWTEGRCEVADIPEDIQRSIAGKSILCSPLRSKNQLLGVISMQHSQPSFFTLEDLRTLTTIADFAAIALENAMN